MGENHAEHVKIDKAVSRINEEVAWWLAQYARHRKLIFEPEKNDTFMSWKALAAAFKHKKAASFASHCRLKAAKAFANQGTGRISLLAPFQETY